MAPTLTSEELEALRSDGFVVLPPIFSDEEIATLREETEREFARPSPGRVLESGSSQVRVVHGSHLYNPVFDALVRDYRFVRAAQQLLGSDIYVHQLKLNGKHAYGGGIWEWHQDFAYWHNEDGVPAPRMISIALFLDPVYVYNGPLMFVPKSHADPRTMTTVQESAIREAPDSEPWRATVQEKLKYVVPAEALKSVVADYGIAVPTGPAGSLLFFDSQIVHGSAPNISPVPRRLAIMVYNAVANQPASQSPRPEFLAARDAAPIAESFPSRRAVPS